MLHEHINSVDLWCAFHSFVGVICVSRPGFLFGYEPTKEIHGSKYAVIVGLISASCQALAYITMRKLSSLNFIVIINYFMLTAIILSGTWMLIFNEVLFP